MVDDNKTFKEKRFNPSWLKKASEKLNEHTTHRNYQVAAVAVLFGLMPPTLGFSLSVTGVIYYLYTRIDEPVAVEVEARVVDEEETERGD